MRQLIFAQKSVLDILFCFPDFQIGHQKWASFLLKKYVKKCQQERFTKLKT